MKGCIIYMITEKSQKNIIENELFNDTQIDDIENKFNNQIFEQYKLYVEMTDKISTRRLTENSFFLSLNTALIVFISYFNFFNIHVHSFYYFGPISIAGIVISYMWYRIIQSYRDLNSVKFNIIHQVEKKLPINLYFAEWEAILHNEDFKNYLPFTYVEIGIPWVFIIIYGFIL